jgi:hypothetical protein
VLRFPGAARLVDPALNPRGEFRQLALNALVTLVGSSPPFSSRIRAGSTFFRFFPIVVLL